MIEKLKYLCGYIYCCGYGAILKMAIFHLICEIYNVV
jgi:hypothetical protein